MVGAGGIEPPKPERRVYSAMRLANSPLAPKSAPGDTWDKTCLTGCRNARRLAVVRVLYANKLVSVEVTFAGPVILPMHLLAMPYTTMVCTHIVVV